MRFHALPPSTLRKQAAEERQPFDPQRPPRDPRHGGETTQTARRFNTPPHKGRKVQGVVCVDCMGGMGGIGGIYVGWVGSKGCAHTHWEPAQKKLADCWCVSGQVGKVHLSDV